MIKLLKFFTFMFLLTVSFNSFAQDNLKSSSDPIDELLVVSSKADVFKVPGSVNFLNEQDLMIHNYMDVTVSYTHLTLPTILLV